MKESLRVRLDFEFPHWRNALTWAGDNRKFVVEVLLPVMRVDDDVRQVIRWAYGYDGEHESCEQASDGSTLIDDRFFHGRAKDPFGVGHDYLHKLSRLGIADPSRKIWTFRQAADWYCRARAQFGEPAERGFWLRLGLDLVGWMYWGGRKRPLRRSRRWR
jgi:hypothetical protein